MIKYFVSFTFPENGRQEFGWATVESDHHFSSEKDIVEVTEVLKDMEGKDQVTVLYFQVMVVQENMPRSILENWSSVQ